MQAPMIRVWKTSNDFIVAIGQHCYEMNYSADQPNGVCIYCGTIDDAIHYGDRLNGPYQELHGTDDIPLTILQQTVNLVAGGYE